MSDYYFDRLCRLYGSDGLYKLRAAHVLVCGLGGVGSWAAEAIARSAVGHITLADFDLVGDTNMNRQLPALADTVGREKTAVIAERIGKINPDCKIEIRNIRLTPENISSLFQEKPSVVIDAIDNVTAKCFLIAYCRENSIPIIVSCGSGGRTDPSRICVRDLAETENDALARSVRYVLRQKYDFPRKGRFGITAICSSEIPNTPFPGLKREETKHILPFDNKSDETKPKRPPFIVGTACFVTGTFGFFCASEAVKQIISISNE